jgi:hypothetical protein
MLNKRIPDLHVHIWKAVEDCGHNAPKVADAIMGELFPRTTTEAAIEGADRFLRSGLIAEITRILKSGAGGDDGEQGDFAAIDPAFAALVEELPHKRFFVEARQEQVHIAELIQNPDELDDARRFMRRKGEECIAIARILDQIHAAVVGSA